MFLSDEAIAAYLEPLAEEQRESITKVRDLLVHSGFELDEHIETGKWYTGLLVHNSPDHITAYALGPLSGGFTTFHMMPFYGSKTLQERHGQTLKPYLSGKSCIKFKRPDQIPIEALKDIVTSTPAFLEIARKLFAERKRR